MWCIHIIELMQPLFGKNCFLFYRISHFHMIANISIAVHVFARRILMSFSVDTISKLLEYLSPNQKPAIKNSYFALDIYRLMSSVR